MRRQISDAHGWGGRKKKIRAGGREEIRKSEGKDSPRIDTNSKRSRYSRRSHNVNPSRGDVKCAPFTIPERPDHFTAPNPTRKVPYPMTAVGTVLPFTTLPNSDRRDDFLFFLPSSDGGLESEVLGDMASVAGEGEAGGVSLNRDLAGPVEPCT